MLTQNVCGMVELKSSDFLPAIVTRKFNLPVVGLEEFVPLASQIVCQYKFGNKRYALVTRSKRTIKAHFDVTKTLESIITEQLFFQKKPVTSFLPFHYHLVPGEARLRIAKFLENLSTLNTPKYFYPKWPIDESVMFLIELMHQLGVKSSKITQCAPDSKSIYVCLTHDIDTALGYQNLKKFVRIEQSHGFTSTSFIPGASYDVDYHILRDLVARGFEFGIHGYDHSGRMAFQSSNTISAKLKSSIDRFEKEGIKVEGFRATSYFRTKTLFTALEKYFAYDSSSPDTLNVRGKHPFNGCGSVYAYKRGKLIELPADIPDDGTLLISGYKPQQILNIWKKKLEYIRSVGGLAVHLTHPEPHFSGNERMLTIYGKFLDLLEADKNYKVITCSRVVAEIV